MAVITTRIKVSGAALKKPNVSTPASTSAPCMARLGAPPISEMEQPTVASVAAPSSMYFIFRAPLDLTTMVASTGIIMTTSAVLDKKPVAMPQNMHTTKMASR